MIINQLSTPILLLALNRPEVTQQVFDEIKNMIRRVLLLIELEKPIKKTSNFSCYFSNAGGAFCKM